MSGSESPAPSAPASAAPDDGALVIDKPRGLTSHDVVAAVRRAFGERRVGHTGTLDPLATGVLPLLLGRATRLAQFLSGADKTYEALVRFGWETDTDDETGAPVTPRAAVPIGAPEIERALAAFRGDVQQRPPAYSAKKIAGRRAYAVARGGGAPPALTPVTVTVHRLELRSVGDDTALLLVTCSAGCYVRALARDLGRSLGVGAHLAGLRRLQSGRFRLDEAVPLDDVLRNPEEARGRVLPPGDVLSDLPAVRLSGAALSLVRHGGDVEMPRGEPGSPASAGSGAAFRLVDPDGRLVGIARPSGRPGVLHPAVVLV